jgi:hypothetical protein
MRGRPVTLPLAAALLTSVCTLSAGDGPRVYYSKSFPGSTPAYVSVEVARDGSAVYKEAPDDQEPIDFKLSPSDLDQIFSLAEKLDRFKRPLESGLKVANMGAKTFRFTDGAEKHEVTFNYSLDPDATLLTDWFEKIAETQQLLFDLERTVRYDKLGVNASILRIEASWDRKRLVGPSRFLPLLDRVAKNDSYLNMARERAAALSAAFRAPQPKPPAGQ